MKKIIGGLAVAASLVAGPVFAQANASNNLSMGGTSPDVCLIRAAPTAPSTTNASLTGANAGAGTVAITTLASAANATLQAAAITLNFSAMCNNAHSITLTSTNGGLQNAAAVENTVLAGSTNFIRKVGYTVGYTWGAQTGGGFTFLNDTGVGGSGALSAPATSTPLVINGANDGSLVMTINVAAVANTPVVAGGYSDTLTLAFSSTI